MALKKLYKTILIILIFNVIGLNDSDYEINKSKIDNIISDKIKIENYDGYLYIPKFEYKGLIKTGESSKVLDTNNILFMQNGCKIEEKFGNIVLAGHNNKYVFSILYKLNINDELILYNDSKEYKFYIYEIKTVNVTDTYVLDNVYDKKIITLITCTKNNQKRLIVRGIFKSHNFT